MWTTVTVVSSTSQILAKVKLVNDGKPGGLSWTSVNIDNSLKNDCDCCQTKKKLVSNLLEI